MELNMYLPGPLAIAAYTTLTLPALVTLPVSLLIINKTPLSSNCLYQRKVLCDICGSLVL
jgi:hypothetical protein